MHGPNAPSQKSRPGTISCPQTRRTQGASKRFASFPSTPQKRHSKMYPYPQRVKRGPAPDRWLSTSSFLFPALPTVAGHCIRVRVKLGSSGIRRVRGIPLVGPFAIERWQELEGPPNRRGEVSTRDFHLCGGLPILFTRTDNHAGVAHIALTSMHRSGAKGSLVDPTRRSLQNAGYRLRRIHLLGTGMKVVWAAAHFHGFGVARQGPWITWVNEDATAQPRSIRGTTSPRGAPPEDQDPSRCDASLPG